MIISKWAFPAVLTMYQIHRLSLPLGVEDKAELTTGTEPAGTNAEGEQVPIYSSSYYGNCGCLMIFAGCLETPVM